MNHPIAAQKRAEFLGTIDAIAKAFQTSPIGNISELDRCIAAVLLRALGSLLSSPHQDDLVLNIHNLAEGRPMTAYGPGFTATGVLFEVTNIPDQTMPDAAVADLGTLPAGITPASSLSAWTSGWNGGAGPAWVAQPWENEQAFRQRVIRNCRANGTVGQVVHVWQRAGFWGRNVDGKTIA